jgi:hypothetical protein
MTIKKLDKGTPPDLLYGQQKRPSGPKFLETVEIGSFMGHRLIISLPYSPKFAITGYLFK